MLRKFFKKMLNKNRKSGVGSHHEKHCPIKTSEQRQKHAGQKIPCEVVNENIDVSSTGECLRTRCSHAQ